MSTKYDDGDVVIRDLKKEDIAALAEMIQELAEYEKMPEQVQFSVKDLENHAFECNPPAFRCKVAEVPSGTSKSLVGYAMYFPTYSRQGRSIKMEDLYVRATERSRGVGRRLIDSVAKEVVKMGGCRLDFHVLEWNPARAFYEKKGAVNLTASEKWCCYRISGDALREAADGGGN